MYQNYKNIEFVKPGGLELKDRLVGVLLLLSLVMKTVLLDMGLESLKK